MADARELHGLGLGEKRRSRVVEGREGGDGDDDVVCRA